MLGRHTRPLRKKMEYESDTLTSAYKNRVASKKIFQQWILSANTQAPRNISNNQMTLQQPQTASSSVSSCEQPLLIHPAQQQPQPLHMLHRSPSGAQKKFGSGGMRNCNNTTDSLLTLQTTDSPSSSSLIDYRSLVDLESYTSILPEDSISRIVMDRDNQSVGMRFKDGLEKPVRPPRNSDFAKSKFSSWDDEDKNENSFSSSDASSNFPTLNNENCLHTPATNGYFGKPTVQVHPMPALGSSLSSSTSSISPPEAFKKLPPPVPKKPNQIAKRVNQTNDSFSENEANAGTTSPSPALYWTSKTAKSPNTLSTPIISQQHQAPSKLEKPLFAPSIINSFSDVHLSSIGQSTEPLSMLCNSPSLLSLQNSLNDALNNPEQHTQEQLQELEKRRQQSMESLSKKAYERRLDREAVCEELDQVDQIRVEIFKALSNVQNYNDSILSRLNVHIIQGERLVELETRLKMQLERLEMAFKINNNNDASFDADSVQQRKRRLKQQLDDAMVIRSSYNCRDQQLDDELSHLVPSDLFQEWRFYKSTVLKLNAEKKQIDQKLKNVKCQLEALQSMATSFKPSHSQQEK
uniref:ASD2 domain-containing protein n=1 Tax=Ditylenchus dipsaci TaxID=166011 RepID=A0A915EPI3_9BILA